MDKVRKMILIVFVFLNIYIYKKKHLIREKKKSISNAACKRNTFEERYERDYY